MLFNSYEFIFLFLPVSLLGFHLIGKQGHHRVAIAWLVAASLFFYGWWNPAYLELMLFSILFNYSIGISLSNFLVYQTPKRTILIIGIVVNLAVLGYFKYANFFVDNLNDLANTNLILQQIILPLAISFFTFQQIAYLVDAYKGETKEYSFLHYCLFVTFFPQLIAGPIVHHKEMLPQFSKDIVYKLRSKNLTIGITIFVLGLFKKVVLADGVSIYATPVFDAAEAGVMLTFFEAWGGALAYTFQLYFDFSGYSDMAIGIARMFNIRLPLNFNSPYKATSIIDFWRRWHITLSRFLRDYLYIPLGGSRRGKVRRYVNLMITMVLGGLWHGANWTFVLWGALHGFYLVINHIWRVIFKEKVKNRLSLFLSWMITFLAVVVSWVPFRSETLSGAENILSSMIGLRGFSISPLLIDRLGSIENWLLSQGVVFNGSFYNGVFGNGDSVSGILWIFILFIIAAILPNTFQIMRRYHPAFETYKNEISKIRQIWIEWRPTYLWSFFISILFVIAVLELKQVSEFLYFQF
jgi:D-alanyl-lipoteichoic acid acyltransferase DltB (MBOAT superfamily)